MRTSRVYLASPYSDASPQVQQERFSVVCYVAGGLLEDGYLVFSPIAHCHPIHLAFGLPGDWTFWQKFDEWMIDACDCVVVLGIHGWTSSKGVRAEIDYARKTGKGIYLLDWDVNHVGGAWEKVRVESLPEITEDMSWVARKLGA